jgi:hypothetical protein
MSFRTAVLSLILAIGASVAPGVSFARGYVEVDVAPPPPREEVIPEARVGYVWVPGYWAWRHHNHVWVHGHYVRERHGHHWVAATWNHEGRRYRFQAGHWDRDRD